SPPLVRTADIGLDHLRIVDHVLGRAAGDGAPLIEYQHAVGEAENDLHDVLGDHQSDAALVNPPHQLDGRLDLDRIEAGQRFVEQHEARRGGEHAGNLQ